MRFDFQKLQSLLRRHIDDTAVIKLMGTDISRLERDEYYGSISFVNEGVELVFKEAPWVIQATDITDSKALYIAAFHFHRKDHDGYSQYIGSFPSGAKYNDSEAEVRSKLGEPMSSGGGGYSNLLKKTIPRWLRYNVEGTLINFQFDANGKVEMATLFVEEPKKK